MSARGWGWAGNLGPQDIPDLTFGRNGDDVGICDATRRGFICTRLDGHTCRHAAGTGERVVAVWGDDDA